jgi:hypothetical protein
MFSFALISITLHKMQEAVTQEMHLCTYSMRDIETNTCDVSILYFNGPRYTSYHAIWWVVYPSLVLYCSMPPWFSFLEICNCLHWCIKEKKREKRNKLPVRTVQQMNSSQIVACSFPASYCTLNILVLVVNKMLRTRLLKVNEKVSPWVGKNDNEEVW